ncbi:hypothetical protein F4553_002079 [Allocatelliglobosispora scoriae]|uniref:Uncharacterized protein n=1 Tax=Allocatelliglobosispora scoriae TaxID=643052 RepID=A0A841BPF8_9ACTN|nr:hypothetical protein [Allocatelliglobosispora scoriae]MBB5868700.1 hypothetical protein [Allocatelliglobosispora scoriae]
MTDSAGTAPTERESVIHTIAGILAEQLGLDFPATLAATYELCGEPLRRRVRREPAVVSWLTTVLVHLRVVYEVPAARQPATRSIEVIVTEADGTFRRIEAESAVGWAELPRQVSTAVLAGELSVALRLYRREQ